RRKRERGARRAVKPGGERVLVGVGDRAEQREREVLADRGGGLQQALVSRGQPIDARGQNRLHGRRDLNVTGRARRTVPTALTDESAGFYEHAHTLLEEERIAFRPLDQEPLDRLELRIVADEDAEERVRALRRQGIDPELGIVSFIAPVV